MKDILPIDQVTTVTIGWLKSPILKLMSPWLKGRMEMILSGHCPDCGKTFVGHSCNCCPPKSFQI